MITDEQLDEWEKAVVIYYSTKTGENFIEDHPITTTAKIRGLIETLRAERKARKKLQEALYRYADKDSLYPKYESKIQRHQNDLLKPDNFWASKALDEAEEILKGEKE